MSITRRGLLRGLFAAVVVRALPSVRPPAQLGDGTAAEIERTWRQVASELREALKEPFTGNHVRWSQLVYGTPMVYLPRLRTITFLGAEDV